MSSLNDLGRISQDSINHLVCVKIGAPEGRMNLRRSDITMLQYWLIRQDKRTQIRMLTLMKSYALLINARY